MSINWQTLRILTAILIVAAGAFIGIYGMLNGESLVAIPSDYTQTDLAQMIGGLKQYCSALGLLLLFAGIAYVLVGYNDKVATNITAPEDDE